MAGLTGSIPACLTMRNPYAEEGNTNTMMIQQRSREDLSRPWPIYTDRRGFIEAGRPDAARIIGFQKGDIQHIEVWTEDVTTPEQIIGLVPVFVAKDGSGLFAVTPEVERVTITDGE